MLSLPDSYIAYLEQTLNLDLSSPPFSGLKPFLPHIRHLSEQLSKNSLRSGFTENPYLNNTDFRRAYQLYYTTANVLKIYTPLNDIARSDFFKEKKEIKVLDIGAGTGSMILGFLAWLESENINDIPDVSITAADYSGAALRELQNHLLQFRKLKINTIIHDLRAPLYLEKKFDLVFAGNVLNELTDDIRAVFLKSLTALVHPEGYIISIEPALKGTSRGLLEFRDTWIRNGGFLYSPCLTRKPCPALVHPDDWCHHDVPWQRPAFIEFIDESIGLIKKSLKFSYMILTLTDKHMLDFCGKQRDFEHVFRMVSELFIEKGRYRTYLCNDRGRMLFEKNKRDDNILNHSFNQLDRYDIIRLNNWQESHPVSRITKETLVSAIL